MRMLAQLVPVLLLVQNCVLYYLPLQAYFTHSTLLCWQCTMPYILNTTRQNNISYLKTTASLNVFRCCLCQMHRSYGFCNLVPLLNESNKIFRILWYHWLTLHPDRTLSSTELKYFSRQVLTFTTNENIHSKQTIRAAIVAGWLAWVSVHVSVPGVLIIIKSVLKLTKLQNHTKINRLWFEYYNDQVLRKYMKS